MDKYPEAVIAISKPHYMGDYSGGVTDESTRLVRCFHKAGFK